MDNRLGQELVSKLKQFNKRTVRASEPLLFQGEVPQLSYIVIKGIVKIYDIDSNGNEKIVSFATPGDILAPAWSFSRAPVSLYYYNAFTDVIVCALPRQELAKIIKTNRAILEILFEHHISTYIAAQIQINALEQSKANEKIVYTLQYLLLKFGTTTKGGWTEIGIRLTHQDIANMNGLTRETTTTELNKLRKKGIIKYKGQVCHVNTAALTSILSSEELATLQAGRAII